MTRSGEVTGGAPPGAPRLATRDLSKSFPGTKALDRVSLAFEAGKVSALIGKNGAGKSTLVRILAGAVRPTSGTLLLDGQPLSLASPRDALARGIATVHQELSLIPGLSVGENILFGRLPRRPGWRSTMIDWPEVDRRSRAILQDLGVALDVRAPVSRLSLAHQQMVEIARVRSFEPRAVLFDEPTAGLARAEVEALFALIRRLAAQGVAVVYVTHRLSELREIADTVTALRDGKHVATIPVADASPATLVELMFGEAQPPPSRRRSAPKAEPVLEVRGLCHDERFFDVDLTLHKGEVLGLAGMLGSGRTELLMCLFGALKADSGEIRICGKSIRRRTRADTPVAMKASGLALVPENRKAQGLVTNLSTLDNLSMAALDRIAPRRAIWRSKERRAARPIIQHLQISVPDLDEPVSVLSGGNQQKVVIGKWLQTRPRIILLDEPTRGIDVQAKRQVFDIVRRLGREGVASIFVSSELEELLEVCDRILVMRAGRIAETVVPDQIDLGGLFSLCMQA